ncbi:3-deoxy-D-manno-octulosonic acid transferase [Neptunitalea chrysea]|uniref:3-deoxy-D-manno-octulosonic acid transferase n=1 Tax=Neptunitalea chrysea TaxID=1647581 RepID=A0A9W6EWM3_9FLAO|nr:glycosyltransferase N-terminal domain-containing protein [Neptunitalea chrysea]GLB54112.1 3-deoxy-D-manno-octulosonic acid transferase [Neptunitalea chrysea]
MYSILLYIIQGILTIIALFNKKIKLFIVGRKQVFSILSNALQPNDKVIWMHTASLGEFEQGLPILHQLKQQYPTYKLVVTFFSPSGYEVKKNSTDADVITYLPLDTKQNVTHFLNTINPKLALFVKYEFWPNYLNELKRRNIPTLLVSGIFREKQSFFKWYGGYMRTALKAFNHFFLQEEQSEKLLHAIGFTNTTVCGDTRFDRVLQILKRNNTLDFVEQFKDNKPCVVIGSSWPEDEALLLPFINNINKKVKFIIAPHEIKPQKIAAILSVLQKKVICYTQMEQKNLADYDVLIIDTIGLLTKVYSYANIAYVGGGMGTSGLHNTLEPAVFGIPVLIGKNYKKFNEAKLLVEKGGIISVTDANQLTEQLNHLLENPTEQQKIGTINSSFLQANSKATEKIMGYINKNTLL